jgi:nucleoside-diphosphate-sugar epimerase
MMVGMKLLKVVNILYILLLLIPMKSSRNREALVPAAKGGTLRVLNAGIEANVEKIILTSSIVAMFKKPNRTNPYTFGENDWTDTEWSGSNDYALSKQKLKKLHGN